MAKNRLTPQAKSDIIVIFLCPIVIAQVLSLTFLLIMKNAELRGLSNQTR